MRLFVATKAFIEHNGKILVLAESQSYKDASNRGQFDVPGGRLNPGEHFLDALKREIMEETSLTVTIGTPFFMNEWRPTVRGEQWQIVGTFFHCQSNTQNVTLSEDHSAFKWIDPLNYQNESLIPNLHPAFETFLNK